MKKVINLRIVDPLNQPNISIMDENQTPIKNYKVSSSHDLVPYKSGERKEDCSSYKVLKIRLEIDV